LKAYHGRVWKCAGNGAENPEHRAFWTNYWTNRPDRNRDPVYLPGCLITDGFKGDRIRLRRVRVVETKCKGHFEPGELASGINSCVIEEVL